MKRLPWAILVASALVLGAALPAWAGCEDEPAWTDEAYLNLKAALLELQVEPATDAWAIIDQDRKERAALCGELADVKHRLALAQRQVELKELSLGLKERIILAAQATITAQDDALKTLGSVDRFGWTVGAGVGYAPDMNGGQEDKTVFVAAIIWGIRF